jgi:predicted metallo-beta-lactamase superfamily hydrolase
MRSIPPERRGPRSFGVRFPVGTVEEGRTGTLVDEGVAIAPSRSAPTADPRRDVCLRAFQCVASSG